jgi:uncharacterized protein
MKWSILALACLAPSATWGQQNTQPAVPVVTVSATATVEREPERAQLLLAVETTGPTAREASQANAARMDALIAALRRLGISGPNVRTISYNLQPAYAHSARPPDAGMTEPRITGYQASNMVQVTIDSVPRVGPIIDGAIQAGANRVASLSFELKDPQSARVEALRLAMVKAQAEAAAIARAAGQRLGAPLNITTGGYAVPFATEGFAMQARAMQDVPTPIEAGTLKVTAQVTVTYKLEGI